MIAEDKNGGQSKLKEPEIDELDFGSNNEEQPVPPFEREISFISTEAGLGT